MKNTLKMIGTVLCGGVVYWLGGLDTLLSSLLVLMVLDYISGVLRGVVTHTLSSRIGFYGIARKIVLLMVVALAFIIQRVLGHAFPLREVVVLFFIGNEGLSILENSLELGIPLPEKLKEYLISLTHGEKKE